MEREITPSPFSIDFGGMYLKIARFHKAQRLKTLLLSNRLKSLRISGDWPSHQKRDFFDGSKLPHFSGNLFFIRITSFSPA